MNTLITGYMLLIDDGAQGPFRIAHDASRDPSKFNATIFGLEAMTTYRITAYAINKAGNGANASEVICYTATLPGVPGTPTMITSSATTI